MIFETVLFFLILILLIIIIIKFWNIARNFHHQNHTFMDLVFVSLYFLEQFAFLSLYYFSIENRELWVGLVVLFTTTTASLDKIMMNSRQRRLSVVLNRNIIEKGELLHTLSNIEKENRGLKSDNRIMERILNNNLEEEL